MSAYVQWLRAQVGPQKIFVACAEAVIADGRGRLLLQLRGDFGTWGLPGGGMELGERVDQTITREVYEETGLRVEPTRLVGLYTSPEFDWTYPNGDQVQIFSAFIACRLVGGRPRPDGVESLEVAFVDPAWLSLAHHIRVQDARRNQPGAIVR